jgi:hypothetical protein
MSSGSENVGQVTREQPEGNGQAERLRRFRETAVRLDS